MTPPSKPAPGARPAGTARRTRTTPTSAATPAAAATTEARRPRVTRRALIMALVVAVLLISYASSLRAYLHQRSHLADLRSQISSSQARVDTLEQAKARWKDDGYVRSQARERLGWVLPGDTAYQVIDAEGHLLDSSDQLADPDQVVTSEKTPWWVKQYSSLRNADHPPAKKRAPVGKLTQRTPGE